MWHYKGHVYFLVKLRHGSKLQFFKEIKVKHAECSHHLQQYAFTNMHLRSCRFILSQNFPVYLIGVLIFENSGTITVMCWLL